MAITFINQAGGVSANATSGWFDVLPPDPAAGDLAIAWWYTRDNTKTFTENADTTQKHDTAIAGSGRLFIGYHVVTQADVDATTFGSWTSSSVANATTIWGTAVFRGVDTSGDPFEAQSGTPAAFTNAINPDPPAVVTVTAGAFALAIFGKNNDYTSITVPSLYTTAGEASSTLGTDASAGVAYREIASPGSADPAAWTLGGGASTDDGIVWTGALKPFGAAAGDAQSQYIGGGYYPSVADRIADRLRGPVGWRRRGRVWIPGWST